MGGLEEIARLGGLVAGIAAGVAGATYLTRRGVRGFRLLQRAGAHIARLAAIGSAAVWPNGSTDLPSSMQELYRRQAETHTMLKRLIRALGYDPEEFIADVEIDQVRGTDRWDPPQGTPDGF